MNKYLTFLLLIGLVYALSFLNSYVLNVEQLVNNDLAEKFSYEKMKEFIEYQHKWSWLFYIFALINILIKLTLVACCLSVGALFVNNRFEFKKMWGVALVAEFVFLVPIILKIFWFAFIQTDYTLKDLQLFYPLSLLNFFDVGSIEPWLLYPLQVFNVFEVAYWLLLAWRVAAQPPPPPMGELNAVSEMSFGAGLQLVLVSYGSGLLVWVASVMFLTLSYS